MKTGIKIITDERKRQVEDEGWDSEHDKQHDDESLAMAACYYALPDEDSGIINLFPRSWDIGWANKGNKSRIDDLAKAGALIAAEIDRLLNTD